MNDLAIRTYGLTRSFGHTLAVDHVDLQVPKGSIYGYLGRNGAGKTTTIQMLMGLILPSEGTMSVMGFDPLRQDVEMKRVASYVPERAQMPDKMTMRELMDFGRSIHPHWDSDLAHSLRRRLDLPEDAKFGQLSRGMQGKAALLTALAPRPQLLILDDSTMGLDVIVRREFMESLILVLQETGVSVFFSSHQLDDVERLADWIGILHQGHLIVQSSLESLKESVRRLVVTFPDANRPLDVPNMLQHEQIARQHIFTVSNYDDTLPQRLYDSGALAVDVAHCSLEDIFIAIAREQHDGPLGVAS